VGNSGTYGHQAYAESIQPSFGIQQSIGFGTVIDVAWVANLGRHLATLSGSGTGQNTPMNEIPMWSRYDPANANPWSPAYPKRSWSDNFFRPLQGLGAVANQSFQGSSNYHSLQVDIRRGMRRGIAYQLAYTWNKTMSYGAPIPDSAQFPFLKARDHNSSFPGGTAHRLVANFIYEIPKLGKRLNLRPLGWITDNWSVSGIWARQGPYFSSVPGCCNFSNTTNTNPAPEFTGSAQGARMIVLRNPTVPSDKITWNLTDWTQNNTFDWQAFMIPYPCSWVPGATPQQGIGKSTACFGNAGGGALFRIPLTLNNWDITLIRDIPLKGERFKLTFRAEAYNVFNHTQFNGLNTTIQYDYPSWQQGILRQTNNQLGRFTSARDPRRMAMTLRVEF
jgi:hypothetical protein